MRAAKVQASLRIRAVSPEPSLLAHISSESRGTFRQKTRSLAPLNGWACAVKICHDGMLEDTNSLDGAHMYTKMEENVNHVSVSKISISHQNAIFGNRKLNFSIGKHCHQTISYRSFKHFDEHAFIQDLSLVPWEVIQSFSNVMRNL